MNLATIRRSLRRSLAAAIVPMLLRASCAFAQVSVEGSTVRERRAQPGETYSGSFTVVNAAAEPQEAKIYQTDYVTDAAGTNTYGPAGTSSRSNGGWITLAPSALVIPPRSSREVTFTVTVPTGRPLSGSYWSMVMVEGVPPGSAESTLPASPTRQVQAAVTARVRYAVQVITQVGAAEKPVATFTAPAVHSAPDGTKELQVDVANGGIRSFAPAFTVEVYAQDGTRVARGTASREILYPGTSLRQRFRLGALGAGTYRALVTLDAGDDTVFGAQYTLKL
jgi:hypothetical protein